MSVTVIAEAGVNHNGSVDMALKMVDVAADCGADYVKFQTFVPEEVMSRYAGKADYQKTTTDPGESMLEMSRSFWLDAPAHHVILDHCKKRGVPFLSTPFDQPSVDLLVHDLGLSLIKIPSGEITNLPLLLKAARSGASIILSSGMSTLGEVERALSVLAFGFIDSASRPSLTACADAFAAAEGQAALKAKVTLMHCTTEYPSPYSDVNLRAMDTMAAAFGLPTGLSDHTPGVAVAIGAAARGAAMIEKHFTLDRTLPGPDHQASLEPAELAAMIAGVRAVEQALGDGIKRPAPSERKNMPIARKFLVARTAIKTGEPFSEANLAVKRCGGTLSAELYWDWLGRPAGRDYIEDEAVDP